jgi:hypothetical protein
LLFSGSSQNPADWIEASISASFSSRSASSKVPPKGGDLGGELIEALAGL